MQRNQIYLDFNLRITIDYPTSSKPVDFDTLTILPMIQKVNDMIVFVSKHSPPVSVESEHLSPSSLLNPKV